MSLRVWLPLNGDTHNQGLSNITVTNNGATVDSSGKIGSCYYFNGSAQYLQFSDSLGNIYSNDFSWTVWLKPTDDTRGIIISEYSSTGASNVSFELLANRVIRVYWNGSPDWSFSAIPKDVWSHVAITKHVNTIKVYINGVESGSKTTTLSARPSTAKIRIGDDYRGGTGVSYMGYMNDIRIYDHALSELEIKEIARAKVLHYPLCENLGSGLNLIKNGFGELGTDNWTSKTMFSNDIPEDQPEIKQSVYGNSTVEYIPFWHNCTYRISLWVKSTASSGYSYPSFIPYDIDKNQIQVRHTEQGFNMSTMTTLAQPLNPGDTKIYVTDLSKWNTASGHYYNYAAIFGYADSTGYIYPDGIYTRNIPAFGSGTTAKTNLDKTNNIINLNNAYSGPAIPAGRSICASSDGATYYYPFGSIVNTSIQDWTYKTITFTSNASYLVAARFLRFINIYNTTYCAGIKLVNESIIKTNNIIYDISGYCNNGTIIGDLEVSPDTPKYNLSTVFDGNSSIKFLDFNLGNVWSAGIWFYSPSTSTKTWSSLFTVNNNGGDSDLKMNIYYQQTSKSLQYSANGQYQSSIGYPDKDKWHQVFEVFDGTNLYCYLDGSLIRTKSITNSEYIRKNLIIGARSSAIDGSTTTGHFEGKLSDFRIYATALSAQDILSLYHNSALVDEQGIIHGAIH